MWKQQIKSKTLKETKLDKIQEKSEIENINDNLLDDIRQDSDSSELNAVMNRRLNQT